MRNRTSIRWRSAMTRRRIMIGAIIGAAVLGVAALVGVAGHYAILKDDDDDDDDGRDAVARGSRFAKVSLQQGLIASEKEGQPISGKFEVDRGKFQLSVYTVEGGEVLRSAGRLFDRSDRKGRTDHEGRGPSRCPIAERGDG